MTQKTKKKIIHAALGIVMWTLSLLIIIPLVMIILNALKTVPESAVMSLRLPEQVMWENFVEVLQDEKLVRSFFNSLLLGVGSCSLTLLLSAMAAFILVRNKSRVNRIVYMIFLLGLVAPLNYITTVKVMQMLHIINTYLGAILLYTAIFIPFTVFIFYGFIGSLPKNLDEAALIDGCKIHQVFFLVIFPLLKPVTVTAVVLNFLNCWNDFVIPLYFLNSSKKWGMIMQMYNYFSQYISSWNLVCAAMIINMIPITLLYIFSQKYLVAGMTAGAVKG